MFDLEGVGEEREDEKGEEGGKQHLRGGGFSK